MIGIENDRYRIVEEIGSGGMATVYKAIDTRLEITVALKVIRTDLFGKATISKIKTRFVNEARIMSELDHENLVPIFDFGEHGDVPFMVMRYLPGGTLKQRMHGPMDHQQAIAILLPIMDALIDAHSRKKKVIHRDIKPSNILFDARDKPFLADFGIASSVMDEETGLSLTGTGYGVGTPGYMAPEQGKSKDPDARADIYSLGVVLFEMVTGTKPFDGETPLAILIKHMVDPLPSPKGINSRIPDSIPNRVNHRESANPSVRHRLPRRPNCRLFVHPHA